MQNLVSHIIRILKRICLLPGLMSGGLYAQNFIVEEYDEKQGMPDNYVYTVFQDQRGFVWLGTPNGLSRFDGTRFSTLDTSDGLPDNHVNASLKLSDGTFLLGHQNGSLSHFDGYETIIPLDSAARSPINQIIEDPRGFAWAISQNEGLVLIDANGNPTLFPDIWKYRLLVSIAMTPDSNLLVGTNEGLFYCRVEQKGDSWKPVIDNWSSTIPPTRVNSILPSNEDGKLWVASADGLFLYDHEDDIAERWTVQGERPLKNILDVNITSDGHMWVSFSDMGFARYIIEPENKTFVQIPALNPRDHIYREFVHTIFQDQENQLWFGTYGSGSFTSRKSFSQAFNHIHKKLSGESTACYIIPMAIIISVRTAVFFNWMEGLPAPRC